MSPPALRRLAALLSLSLVGAGLGCAPPAEEAPAPGPAVVTVSRPVRQEVTDHATFTGRLAAVESVEVRARVTGYLQEVAYQPGQEVKEGQLLFRIDPTIYQAALERAQSDVTEYRALVDLLTEEFGRSRRLLRSGAVSAEAHQKVASQRQQASANLAGARAAVKTAKQNLAWAKVTAPIDGKAGVNRITRGNLVVADQTLLTTLVSQDPIHVLFDVDERTLLRVRELIRQGKATSYRETDYPVAVGLTNEEGYPHRGTIDYVSPQVNPGTGPSASAASCPTRSAASPRGCSPASACPLASRTPPSWSLTAPWAPTRASRSCW